MKLRELQKLKKNTEYRIQNSESREESSSLSRVIIEMIMTIMVYKFEQLSPKEIELMLGITLKETRVYQEIKEEGRQEGRQEEDANLIIRILAKRFGELSNEIRSWLNFWFVFTCFRRFE